MMNNIFWLYSMCAVLFFGRGIEDIVSTPIFFYEKEILHLTVQNIMYLSSLVTIAWMIKPFIGYLIDSTTFGKKFWIMIALIVSSLIALIMGIMPYLTLPLLIGFMAISSWNSAICNVAVDGEVCVIGKEKGLTGALQSVQWGAITLASVLVGVGGGYIAEHFHYQTAYLCLLPLYIGMLLITLQYKPKQQNVVQNENILITFKKLFSNKELLWVCLFLFLYNLSLSFGTALTFIERDQWHWSKLFIGTLSTIGAVASIIGCGLYWKFSKVINLNKWIYYGVWIGALNTICYLYFTPLTCILYNIIGSVTSMFFQLVLLDYMARKSLTGLESMSFALLCSVVNITSTVDTLAGGFLFPIIGLKWCIIIASLTSFACLPILKKVKL